MNVPTIISFRDFCIRLPANPEQRRSHSKEEAKKSKRIFILFNTPKISPPSLPAFAMIRPFSAWSVKHEVNPWGEFAIYMSPQP